MNLRGYWQNIGEIGGGGGEPITLPEVLYFRRKQRFGEATVSVGISNIVNGKHLYYRLNENEYKKIYSGGYIYHTTKVFEIGSGSDTNYYNNLIIPDGTTRTATNDDKQYQVVILRLMSYYTLIEPENIITELQEPNIIFSLPENKKVGDIEISSLQDITDMYCIDYENSYNYQKQPNSMVPYKFNGRYVTLGSGGSYPSHVNGYTNQVKFKEEQNKAFGNTPSTFLSYILLSNSYRDIYIIQPSTQVSATSNWNLKFPDPGLSLDYDVNRPFVFGFTRPITIGYKTDGTMNRVFEGEIPLILNYKNMLNSTAPVKIICGYIGNSGTYDVEIYTRLKMFSEVS